jgi:Transposase DDE domain group 1
VSDREALLKVKVTERSALVLVAASTQQLTSHAGLVLVRELAGRLGVAGLLDRVTVKKRSRGYSPSQAILGLCETLIAGGECLDDVALLRGDSAQELLRGHRLPEPTTLGRFLRRFSLGHIGQLNRALDELFARVHPLLDRETVTLDLDATYIEHHGPVGSRQGTRGTYKGKVCWHPLLCFVGETGEWLHAKLRNGHAAASTGATRFLDECLRRLPVGARVFLRADEGFWGQDFFAELKRKQITYAVGAPLIASVRGRISEIAEADWQPSCYREGSEVVSFRWRPKTWKKERRFIVRRDPAEAGEQLTLEGREWHYWAIVTNDEERSADALECWHRAKANLENQIKEAKLGLGLDNLPCKSFHANWAYLLVTLLAFNLLAWLKLLALPERERTSYAKRLRFRFIAVAGTVGRSGRRLVLRLSAGYPLLNAFLETLQRIRGLARAPA